MAKSSIDRLWHSLGSLWESRAPLGRLGNRCYASGWAELARIKCADGERLIRMVLLSSVARAGIAFPSVSSPARDRSAPNRKALKDSRRG